MESQPPQPPALHLIVEPPEPPGGRPVRVGDELLGVAHSVADVMEMARHAGLDGIDAEVPVIEWRGPGSEVWS